MVRSVPRRLPVLPACLLVCDAGRIVQVPKRRCRLSSHGHSRTSSRNGGAPDKPVATKFTANAAGSSASFREPLGQIRANGATEILDPSLPPSLRHRSSLPLPRTSRLHGRLAEEGDDAGDSDSTRTSSLTAMSVWLPRAPAPLLLRTFSRHPHLLVSVRTYAAVSQQSRLPLHPLYASGHGHVNPIQPELRRDLHSSPAQQDTPTTSTTGDPKALPPTPKDDAPLAARVWKKVKHEVQHYWHGSKLLAAEVRISSRLQWKLLHGESLTRRERRQVRVPCFL